MFKVALCVALTSTAEGAEGKCQGDFCTADVSDAVETSLVQTGLHFITAHATSTATTAPCTGQSWTAGKVPLHLPDEYWKLENCDNYPCAEDTLDWCYSDSERRNDKDLCESHYLVYPNAESVKACEWQEGGGCSNAKEEQDCPKVVAKCTGQSWTAGKFPLQLPDKYWEHDNCGDYPCPKDTIEWCRSDVERRKDKYLCESHYLEYPNAEKVRGCVWKETTGPGFHGGCENAELEGDC